MTSDVDGWAELGQRGPGELREARLALHYAAQVAAAAGHTLLARRPDDSQASLTFSARLGALLGEPLPTVNGGRPLRAGLRLGELSLLVADAGGEVLAEVALAERTLDEATRWLAD